MPGWKLKHKTAARMNDNVYTLWIYIIALWCVLTAKCNSFGLFSQEGERWLKGRKLIVHP